LATLAEQRQRAAAGEDVVVGKVGKLLVRLVPYSVGGGPRMPGALRGRIWVADDFDESPQWLLDAIKSGGRG